MPRFMLALPPDDPAVVAEVDALAFEDTEVGELDLVEEEEPHAATAMGTTMARGMRRFKEFFPFCRSPARCPHPSGTVVCFIRCLDLREAR